MDRVNCFKVRGNELDMYTLGLIKRKHSVGNENLPCTFGIHSLNNPDPLTREIC